MAAVSEYSLNMGPYAENVSWKSLLKLGLIILWYIGHRPKQSGNSKKNMGLVVFQQPIMSGYPSLHPRWPPSQHTFTYTLSEKCVKSPMKQVNLFKANKLSFRGNIMHSSNIICRRPNLTEAWTNFSPSGRILQNEIFIFKPLNLPPNCAIRNVSWLFTI